MGRILRQPIKNKFWDVDVNSLYPNSVSNSLKTWAKFIYGPPASGELKCEPVIVSGGQISPYRRIAVYPKVNNSVGQFEWDDLIYAHMDEFCTRMFGRGYKKPGARWHRRRQSTTYYFRTLADAAIFKFQFHNMEYTDNGKCLNGEQIG